MSYEAAEEITPEQILAVEEYAGYFFTPAEIAVILGMREQWARQQMLIENNNSFKAAYNKGQLIAEAQIRKSIFDLAKSGSGPAQVLAVQFMEKFQLKKVDI